MLKILILFYVVAFILLGIVFLGVVLGLFFRSLENESNKGGVSQDKKKSPKNN
ncbi:MAG: hypothetical protein WC682_04585 [Parcubacteria group bacterium]|jgi:hypothetical protein